MANSVAMRTLQAMNRRTANPELRKHMRNRRVTPTYDRGRRGTRECRAFLVVSGHVVFTGIFLARVILGTRA